MNRDTGDTKQLRTLGRASPTTNQLVQLKPPSPTTNQLVQLQTRIYSPAEPKTKNIKGAIVF